MKCSLVALSKPHDLIDVETAEHLIAYCARVSNPANQANMGTADKLIQYLIANEHWSPLEMVSMTIGIETTRDIARQILRHRSFSFQEFSQRYAKAVSFELREARLQDNKNRQNSIEFDQEDPIAEEWINRQEDHLDNVQADYEWALDNGIAKEQARAILPEGNTSSTLYMAGTLRSWIHYCQLRMANGTQKEHREIALAIWEIVGEHFPNIVKVFQKDPIAILVEDFSRALEKKLRASEEKYGWNNGFLEEDWYGDWHDQFHYHIDKGDPLDVAAYCAFAHHHKWRTN